MSDSEYPVTVAVRRPDGSIEQVRVGTAIRAGDGFRLSLGELSIGASPEPRRAAPVAAPDGGAVFPPYGRSKGAPVAGASIQDLEYYASGCRRTLGDPNKSRWHDKERQLLAAIEAELARQGAGSGGNGRSSAPPRFRDEEAPPPFRDEDAPFGMDDTPF